MLKSPITKDGNIRYLELFKIVALLSFFFSAQSMIFTSNLTPLISASPFIVSIISLLFYAQFTIFIIAESRDLLNQIKSYVISFIKYNKDFLLSLFVGIDISILTIKKGRLFTYKHRRLSVVRC